MTKAMYPGTFDPVTLGHLDVIRRAARIFDRLVVAVGENPEKSSLFSREERAAMIRHEIGRLRNVEVKTFRGLIVDFAQAEKVSVILRGIRTVSDLEYEIQMAFTNRASGGVETVFIAPQPEHAFIHTRFIKQIAAGGGRVNGMVSPAVEARLRERLVAATRAGRKPGRASQ